MSETKPHRAGPGDTIDPTSRWGYPGHYPDGGITLAGPSVPPLPCMRHGVGIVDAHAKAPGDLDQPKKNALDP